MKSRYLQGEESREREERGRGEREEREINFLFIYFCSLQAGALAEEEGELAGWSVAPKNWRFARGSFH